MRFLKPATLDRNGSFGPGSLRKAAARVLALLYAGFLPALIVCLTGARADTVVISLSPEMASGDASGLVIRALAKARKLRARGARKIEIHLAAGNYMFARPVLLGPEDSGQWGQPLVIKGAGAERTRIFGSVRLIPYRGRWSKLRTRLPAIVRRKVVAYQLPMILGRPDQVRVRRRHGKPAAVLPFEVFDRFGALRPARWPNNGWTRARGTGRRMLRLRKAPVAKWVGEGDLWVSGYFRHDWSFETLPVGRVKQKPGSLVLADRPHHGIGPNGRVYVMHALAELDQAGEWYYDAARRLLLVWPRRGGGGKSGLRISVATSLFVLEQARHIRLEKFSGVHVRSDAIVVRSGMNVGIADVSLRWAAGQGVVVENAPSSRVVRSRLTDLGEGGITLAGGDRPLLRSGNLLAADNIIERFSRLGRTFKPAIALKGVGNRAVGNFIAHGPHTAIYLHGNDHQVRLNEIANVVSETSDAGVIYAGRDVTARGNRISHNFIHDIRAAPGFEVKGIYLDEFASGFRVAGNVFLRVQQPVFIGGGRDNIITGNLFVDASPAVHIDARGLTWARSSVADPSGVLRDALARMPVGGALWRKRYPTLSPFLVDDPHVPKRNAVVDNVVIGGQALRLRPEVDRRLQSVGAPVRPGSKNIEAAGLADGLAAARSAREVGRLFQDAGLGKSVLAIPFSQLDRRLVLRRR